MAEPITDGSTLTNDDLGGFARRAFLRAQGRGAASSRRRPVIGICTSWSELNPCNMGLRDLAEGVKRGIVGAGGQAYEFPTISLGEQFVAPTSMILRNLMAMDVEEMIRRSPVDGVVLLAGCDKTVPAQLMGAASADRPAVMLTAGPRLTTHLRGEPLVTDDFWTLAAARQLGDVDDETWNDLEGALCASVGVCNVLGTATTMAIVAEVLGVALAGSALVGATDARRHAIAEDVGETIVSAVAAGRTPSAILTEDAFDNALRTIVAVGGSTNAVLHLEAIAGRVGLRLGSDRLDRISAATPLVTAIRPNGPHLLEDLEDAGGVPAVLHALGDLIESDASTVIGETIGDIVGRARSRPSACLRTVEDPFAPAGGIGSVQGNLAPRGAIIKRAAADARLLVHEGPALVYDGYAEARSRALDPSLDCDDDAVLVVRGAGPLGGPGMPELGPLPIPIALRRRGITDMVCVTDARVSGTQKGATVLHATPESAAGGPLAAIRDGDIIRLDSNKGTIDVGLSEEGIQRRLDESLVARAVPTRGYERLYHDHVLQADEGCDFDFLRHPSLEPIWE